MSSGPGIAGASAQGNGIVGTTTFASPDASHEHAGVVGQDLRSSTFSFGVFGFSTVGTGTRGKRTSGTGVFGTSSTGRGVVGSSQDGTGVVGTTKHGSYGVSGSGNTAGVAGTSTAGYGVYGSGYYGLFAQGTTGLFVSGGTHGTIVALGSNSRYDISAYTSGTNSDGVFSEIGPQTGGSAFHAYTVGTMPVSTMLFTGTSNDTYGSPKDVVTIDATGNMKLAGSLTTSGTPLVHTGTSNGHDVMTFGMRASSPSVEDIGEGKLVNGRAYVPLESAFASTIDVRVRYFVFMTPHGDSKGLYVDQVSPRGFSVFENGDGRSTLTFDYRIIAKPYDTQAARLPSASMFPALEHRAIAPRPEAPRILGK